MKCVHIYILFCMSSVPPWIVKSSTGTDDATWPMWVSSSSGRPVDGQLILLGWPSRVKKPAHQTRWMCCKIHQQMKQQQNACFFFFLDYHHKVWYILQLILNCQTVRWPQKDAPRDKCVKIFFFLGLINHFNLKKKKGNSTNLFACYRSYCEWIIHVCFIYLFIFILTS